MVSSLFWLYSVLININPLPDDKILDWSKQSADDNFEFDVNSRKFSKLVENTVGKGEIARYEQFFFTHSVFKRPVSHGRQKVSLCGNGLRNIKVARSGQIRILFLSYSIKKKKPCMLSDSVSRISIHGLMGEILIQSLIGSLGHVILMCERIRKISVSPVMQCCNCLHLYMTNISGSSRYKYAPMTNTSTGSRNDTYRGQIRNKI